MTRYYRIVVACLAAVVLGIVWTIMGTVQYNGVVERSSSPIGTMMHFNRTDADLVISDYYTDETNSVLIARIAAAEESDLAKLPSSTSDYGVYASARSFNGHDTVPILFGRFSTDGDLFIVIPRPTKEIYSFFLMNRNYFGVSEDDDSDDGAVVDITDETASMSFALSQYRYLPASEKQGAVKVRSDDYDVVGFRMTLDPQFKDDAYKVKVIPGTLLSESGDFDFESFFNAAFKDSASAVLERQYESLRAQMQAYERQKTEYESRIKSNPNDNVAISALADTESDMAALETQIDELVEQMQAYSSLTYDSSLFSNIIGTATVIESE